jgi:outer membrane biosynthesis protein TonB
MGRSRKYLILLALCAVAAAILAACGEEDAELLPGSTANEITANLDTVQQLADEGDCLGAESAAEQVSEQVEAVQGIDPRLKRALREGANRLNEVVSECEEEPEEAVTPVEPPEEEAPEREGKAEKEEKEKKPDEDDDEQEDEEEEPQPTSPGPPEETPPAVPPGQEEAPSGGVGPGSAVGEED